MSCSHPVRGVKVEKPERCNRFFRYSAIRKCLPTRRENRSSTQIYTRHKCARVLADEGPHSDRGRNTLTSGRSDRLQPLFEVSSTYSAILGPWCASHVNRLARGITMLLRLWVSGIGTTCQRRSPGLMIEEVRSCERENPWRSPALFLASRDLVACERFRLPRSSSKKSQRKHVLYPRFAAPA